MTDRKPPSSGTVLSCTPVVVMAVVTVMDVVAGPGIGFLPLVSLGPAFAGLVGGWRRTAVFGLVALVLCVALGLYDGLFEERRGYTALASVAGVTGVGVAAAVMRSRREAELASVRSIAEVAQRVLLRPVPLTAGPLQAAVSYTSAVAEARIGGDLYEVVASPHGVRVIVGDVQGKGLAAVETAAVVLGAFREAAHDEPDLLGLGERLERSVARELEGEKFVTAILGQIGTDHEAVFLNYGHPAPMVVRRNGTVDFPQPPSFALPLGLGAHGSEGPEPYRVDFAPGEQLLLYTDGVTEARDGEGLFYPVGERAHLLKEPDARRALEALRADLAQHSGGPPHDDAAMLLLRYHGHGGHGEGKSVPIG
ncbi:serine/threonine-protein phosphatase [Streptomyces canus]|uniref:PP2C family protein-serine/threonine phosphatase n=1 Tax=Streptomyces canus TaxID=58343 RepID=UPI0022595000|nr:PP2C family protein-serine/threonine phosphatase [Streptomyces canus]MCX4854963.1 serine/threonine-protein phosphatase [Streptomyces canus]WSW39639.1 serine/threonine-protein phosphatase [Streptomyces canus]